MLFGKKKSWLLLAMLSMLAMSSALELDGIHGVLDKRQSVVGTGASASQASSDSAPSSTPSSPSSTPSDNTTPSATPTPTPSSAAPSSTPAPSSSTPEPSSSAPSSNPASTTPEPESSSTPPKATTSKIIVITSALVATSIQQYTTVITEVSGSQTIAATVVSSRTIAQTTGFATVTNPASLNNGGANGSGSSGLNSSSKKIIGGVVGGVGGAILLGGIAIVCWRIWGRKQRGLEDDDDLMGGTGSAIGEKPPSANQNTPFQTNLEQYHNPGGRPNAAANF